MKRGKLPEFSFDPRSIFINRKTGMRAVQIARLISFYIGLIFSDTRSFLTSLSTTQQIHARPHSPAPPRKRKNVQSRPLPPRLHHPLSLPRRLPPPRTRRTASPTFHHRTCPCT